MVRKALMNLHILRYITLLCYISSVVTYSLVDNILQDLTSIEDFNTDAASWTASRLFDSDTEIISPCGTALLLGGYSVLGSAIAGGSQSGEYFQRIYTELPSHTSINFQFEFYAIDSWEGASGDTFQIAFDSTVLDGWSFRSQDVTASNTCGDTGNYDVPGVIIEGTVPHKDTSLVFKVISKLNQDSTDESFGFRGIKFTFSSATPAPTSSTICARSPTVLPDSRKCACSSANEYEYPTGSGNCITCHSTCATCSGSAANQCLTCIPGRYKSGTSCLACDISCNTCDGIGTNACLSCKPGSYLNGVQCLKCHTDCATCLSGTSSSCETCPPGRYKSGNQCLKCHTSCATCDGGAASQCKTCSENRFLTDDGTCVPTCSTPLFETTDASTGIKYCKSPCSATNEYAYWDQTCESSCASPLTEGAIGTYKLCNYGCSLGQYLLWNGTCGACHAPLEVRSKKGKGFCHYKCQLDEYLYWNGDCSSSCPFPLKTRTEGGRQYCDYPCTSSQYLRWDQTCVSSCPAPLQIEIVGNDRYCKFPCDLSMFAYWNGTCSSKGCSTPLVQRIEGIAPYQRKFCDLNCASNEFMHWTGICTSTCDYPLKISAYEKNNNDKRTCNSPCDDARPYYFNDLHTCGKTCVSPRSINDTGLYLVCNSAPTADQGGSLIFFMLNAPIVPHEYTVVVTGSTLDHIHYLDIAMPPRFEKLANSTGKSFLSPRFGYYAPKSLTSRRLLTSFVKYPLPYVFERNGLHSSFLINYWDALTTMAIILIIAISLKILEIILRKTELKTVHGIVERLMVMASVNYLFVIFISSIPEIILYTSLEIRSFLSYGFFNSSSDMISFIINIIMLLLVVAVFALIALSVKKASDADAFDFNERNTEDYIKFAIKWRSCQVLFRGFKSNNRVNKLFFPVYILRLSIPAIFSACLVNYPLIQTIIQVLINVAMVVYLILRRPFQKKANLIQLILFEIFTLILNIFVLLIVVLTDNNLDSDHNITTVMGDIVIVGASILTLLRFVFLIIKAKLEADSIKRTLKEAPHKGIAVWVGLLSVLAQQTGIGFEEIFEERCISDSGNKYMGMLARPAAKEKAAQARNKKIYPDGVSDMEPILLQSNSSFPKIAGSREGTPMGNSILITNNELTPNNKDQPDTTTNLKTRMKQRMANMRLRKDEEQKDSFPEAEQSPVYSIDVSDNAPNYGELMLLKKSTSIEKPSPEKRRGKRFFAEEAHPEGGDSDEATKVLNLYPVHFGEHK